MKMRKLTALLLALCMMLSLSISAFAADAPVASGTIQNSGIRWSLDTRGWLTISGTGTAPVFQSADDQPWAAYREQITEVWYDDMTTLTIPDLAYWFEGCTNLTTAELPLTPVIGRHAFYNCPKLTTLTMYYGETTLNSIGENAFWREADSGDTLTICYILGYPESTTPFHTYDWAASHRENLHFDDVYGIMTMKPVIGTCPDCGKYALQGSYVEERHTSRGHKVYNECNRCHYVEYTGEYEYKDHGDGSYGSWTCPDCGRHTWELEDEREATCTRNGYEDYVCACGETKRTTIYASGHDYRYGDWTDYSASQHRRENECYNCGDVDYEYSAHSFLYGSWTQYNTTLHSRTNTCTICSRSEQQTAAHNYSVGAWNKFSDTQHRRTKTCADCGASAYDYADHTDTNGDGKCDDCGATIALIVTWDAASNGGTVGGKNSVTTSVAPNQTAVAPGYTPVKAGHTFSGWYTEKAGGTLYNTVTITAARTFYAQFAPAEYKITWDLGTGKTETTNQTYGETLNLPTEPTRKGYAFLGWFTQETGGTQVDGNTVFKEVASTTHYAHWEEATVFSVVVPAVLPVTVDQNGKVYVSNAEIVNHSTAAVQVSSVTLTAENGWTLVPYASDMSHAKVDSNQIGFSIRDQKTTKTGDSEAFTLTSPWQINEEESLTLSYDAIVSALSQPVTNANILSVLFVVEWA